MSNKPFIELRRVSSSDAGEILKVYRECEDFLALGPEPKASLKMVLADIRESEQEGGIFCGIFVDGDMVGVVDFVPKCFQGSPDVAFFGLVMIAKSSRNKGLGTRVVSTVESCVREDPQVQRIRTAAQISNPRSIVFWRRSGYEIVSKPERQPDGTTTIYMEKELPSKLRLDS